MVDHLRMDRHGWRWYADQKRWVNATLKDSGIVLSMKQGEIRRNPDDIIPIMRLQARLNFQKLLNCEPWQVAHALDYERIEKNFDKAMESLGPVMPRLWNWKVIRLDVCFNLLTDNVNLYVSRLHKADRGRVFSDWYNPHRHR